MSSTTRAIIGLDSQGYVSGFICCRYIKTVIASYLYQKLDPPTIIIANMKIKFRGCTITTSPQELQAALPEGFELIDRKQEEGGRSTFGRQGHVDRSFDNTFFRGEITSVESVLLNYVIPTHMNRRFTTKELLEALQGDNSCTLLAEHGVVGNTIVLGRTLANIAKRRPEHLRRLRTKGKISYSHDIDEPFSIDCDPPKDVESTE